MTIVVKAIIGLGTLAVGGTGTYLTYDYLSKNKTDAAKPEPNGNGDSDAAGTKEKCNADEGQEPTVCTPS